MRHLESTVNVKNTLADVYDRLMKTYGPQQWWPAESSFEMIVGAILVQSVAWRNVEPTIAKLKSEGLLSPEALRRIPAADLARLCFSCGYYNAKARKLKAFAERLGEHGDDLEAWFAGPTEVLRPELLSIHGVGPETADSILLYAGRKHAFVIDAITQRIVDRIGISPTPRTYDAYQRLFETNLPQDVVMYQEYHALLVAVAKRHCVKLEPRCGGCPLSPICATGRERLGLTLTSADV